MYVVHSCKLLSKNLQKAHHLVAAGGRKKIDFVSDEMVKVSFYFAVVYMVYADSAET